MSFSSHILQMMGISSFNGPLDDYTANLSGAWSVTRRLLSSYVGNLITLRRGSDNAVLDFGYLSNGLLDVTSIITWLGGAFGYLLRIYDQSGNNRHLLQNTFAASQPLFVVGVTPSSQHTARFDGIDDFMDVNFAISQPQHIFSVMSARAFSLGSYIWTGNSAIDIGLIQSPASPQARMFTGPAGDPIALSLGDYHTLTAYYNSADTSYIRRDGTQVNNASNIGANANGVTLGARHDGASPSSVDFSEFIIYSAKKSIADQAAIEADQQAFYL